ncbi:MAG: hypothetical protein H7328_08160 [Bdellovibrio sp.]|nr:hypothetical protein [Bdellovibrio sp.]
MGEVHLRNTTKAIDLDASDLGRPDGLRYTILTSVINEEYDRAIKTLKEFVESESEYPNFKMKVERYALHAIDLIYAIRTKRNFPGLSALTRTKQQELKEKFKEHFKELRLIMKKIENCMEELRISDVKSTRIVVRSLWLAVLTVFCTAVVYEICRGMGYTMMIYFDAQIESILHWMFSFLI